MTLASSFFLPSSVSLGCGKQSSENNTYFENGGSEQGACAFSVCKVNDNVSQLRLDFNTFVISGPATATGKNRGRKRKSLTAGQTNRIRFRMFSGPKMPKMEAFSSF